MADREREAPNLEESGQRDRHVNERDALAVRMRQRRVSPETKDQCS